MLTNWAKKFRKAIPENLNVQQQVPRMNNVQPGGTPSAPSTPDLPNVGKDWHSGEQEEEDQAIKSIKLCKSLLNITKDNINKSIEYSKPLNSKESKFALEVLNKSQRQISDPSFSLSKKEKLMYNVWLAKSMQTKMSSLQDWIKKSN